MVNQIFKFILSLILIINQYSVFAQENLVDKDQNIFHTKRQYVMINYGIGGGNYPFQSLGLNLSYQFLKTKTMLGVGVQYIGNTADGTFPTIDPVQIIPIMVDIRQQFMQSENDRFATYILAAGGYVISLTNNRESEEGEYEFLNGWAINPGVGFRYNLFKNTGLILDITWLHHSQPRRWLAPVIKQDQKNWDVILIRGNIFF